jgi:hypothetical protein
MGSGVTLEMEYWKTILGGLRKPKVEVIPYVPRYRKTPERMLQVNSAWKGIESILADLIERFEIQPSGVLNSEWNSATPQLLFPPISIR